MRRGAGCELRRESEDGNPLDRHARGRNRVPRLGYRKQPWRGAALGEPHPQSLSVEALRSVELLRMERVDPARKGRNLLLERAVEGELLLFERGLADRADTLDNPLRPSFALPRPGRGSPHSDTELVREPEQTLMRPVESLTPGVEAVPCAERDPPSPSPDAAPGLEHTDVNSGALQEIGSREAGEPGADDDHACRQTST